MGRGYRLSADPLEGDLVDLLSPTPGRYGPREMVGVSNAKDPVGDDLFLVDSGHDYDLTDARQLEVGLKADVGGHTEVTAAVFDMERDDVLEAYGPDSVYTIGGIQSRGVELSMVSRPNANAYFGASVAFTNAELVAGVWNHFDGNRVATYFWASSSPSRAEPGPVRT